MTANKGLVGKVITLPVISCCYAFKEKIFVTGGSKGELVQWAGRSASKVHKGHTDAVWAIQNIQNDTMIVTGGNDAKVIFWEKGFAKKKTIDLQTMSAFPAGVRSLDFSDKAKTFVVGTRSAEIIEVDQNGKHLATLMHGHFEGGKKAELWGAACHPT